MYENRYILDSHWPTPTTRERVVVKWGKDENKLSIHTSNLHLGRETFLRELCMYVCTQLRKSQRATRGGPFRGEQKIFAHLSWLLRSSDKLVFFLVFSLSGLFYDLRRIFVFEKIVAKKVFYPRRPIMRSPFRVVNFVINNYSVFVNYMVFQSLVTYWPFLLLLHVFGGIWMGIIKWM